MKKFMMVVLVLIFIPGIFAEGLVSNTVQKFIVPTNKIVKERSYDPNARINLKPTTRPQHVYDGKALGDILMTIDLSSIGMPGDGYDGAGISWDGTYLYYVNQYNDSIFVIDPTIPSIVMGYPSPTVLDPWGCGHENNLWITKLFNDSTFECTYAGIPTGNVFSAIQGGASWMGDASEWWNDGEIWILAVGSSNKAYKFSVPFGVCLDSIGDPAWTYISQRGFTYDPFNNTFWLGGWNSNMIWEVNSTTGTVLRSFPFNNVSGLAYDWQSSLHPTPVLWVATNEASNYIYMVDPDNPPPVTTILWDFETGWQGWTHTNGIPFPGGWGVEVYNVNGHTPPPTPGDSTLWIDADVAGTATDTAWSPVFPPISQTDQMIKWGLYFYGGGGGWINDLYMGIQTYSSGMWNPPVELKHYPNGTSYNDWDSVDVSGYLPVDSMRIYFFFTDFGSWGYYAGVDNIMVYTIQHDVGAMAIDQPGNIIAPNTPFTPTATYKNTGSYVETFNAYYQIDSAGSNIYLETVNLTLNPGDDSTQAFPGYISGDDGVVYDIYAYTVLATDGNPYNDTTYKQTTVFEVINTLVSNWTTIPPTIDGVIDPVTEWGGAHVYDISDVYGYGDLSIPNNPGDCILYLMNDSNNLYMAVDYVADVTLTAYDQIGPYFDENNDNAWDTDSTEGNFWFYWDGSVDDIVYRSIPDYISHSAPGVSYARSLITNQQYEVSIPFGIDTTNFHYLYNTQFPDTFGFFIYVLDQSNGDQGGLWPTIAPIWNDPSTYGDLIITEWQAGVEDDEEIPAVYELSVNNLIASTNGIEIQYSLPEKSDLYIGVYDAMGRVVYSLKRDNVAAGWYNLSVREDIPSGIYFIKMKAGKFEDVKKALVLR
jgi:hypothetical protein